ncbi:unnamed protein product, partial [Rhizoctonia solani]
MTSRTRAATRRLTQLPDKNKAQVSHSWRKRIRLMSPSPASDSDESSSSLSTVSDYGFEGFMNLPVDVFVKIASYFQPQDLLALSRVNSFLRRLLLSRELSEPIWRSARSNIAGLPPCPKEISEPRYAKLLFSKICTSCGARAIHNMDPILLERLCAKCKGAKLVDLAQHWEIASLVFASTTILPRHCENWRGPWCLSEDFEVVKTALDRFDADEGEDEEARDSWIEQRQEMVKAREQSSQPLIEWFQQLEMKRQAELDRRRAPGGRIKTRLMELGHKAKDLDVDSDSDFQVDSDTNSGSDVGSSSMCTWFSLVRNTRPLTDK